MTAVATRKTTRPIIAGVSTAPSAWPIGQVQRGFGDFSAYLWVAEGPGEITLSTTGKAWDVAALKVGLLRAAALAALRKEEHA